MNSKKLKTGINLLIITSLIAIAYSCIKGNYEQYFFVEVESISLPTTAYAEDSITIYMRGYMANSCHTIYDSFLYPQNDDTTTIVIEVYGVNYSQGIVCEEKATLFNHEHVVTFSYPGEYTFVTWQSDSLVEVGKILIRDINDDPIIEEEPFIARIDGIFAQSTAFTLDPVPVYVFGRLGPNNCYIFDYAEFYLQDDATVFFEVYGIQKSGDIVCSGGVSDFTHELTIVFDEPGEYTFVTMQSGKLVEVGKIVVKI